MKVWVIEDEKYGAQVICLTQAIAERELEKGRYHVSGQGAVIVEMWMITE